MFILLPERYLVIPVKYPKNMTRLIQGYYYYYHYYYFLLSFKQFLKRLSCNILARKCVMIMYYTLTTIYRLYQVNQHNYIVHIVSSLALALSGGTFLDVFTNPGSSLIDLQLLSCSFLFVSLFSSSKLKRVEIAIIEFFYGFNSQHQLQCIHLKWRDLLALRGFYQMIIV